MFFPRIDLLPARPVRSAMLMGGLQDLSQRSITANALVASNPAPHHRQLGIQVMPLRERALAAVAGVVRDGTGVEREPGEIQLAQVEAPEILDRTHAGTGQTLHAPPKPQITARVHRAKQGSIPESAHER